MTTDVSCAYCGTKSNQYSINHIYPGSFRGQFLGSEQQKIYVCSTCHAYIDAAPTEIEFVSFLADLMRRSNEYTDIVQEAIIGKESRHRADILASDAQAPSKKKLLIECKSANNTNAQRISGVIDQVKSYAEAYGDCQTVLAIPATLSEAETQTLRAAGVELWDLDYLARQFSKELPDAEPGYYKTLLSMRVARGPNITREDQLSAKLKECLPGKRDWSLYQDLIGDILEHLFCPILNKPLPEHSDSTKTNRRDYILPNYADSGFWHFLQRNYNADFIVVDAKNYTKKVGKGEILQVGNYLKQHGAGLFGIIFSRHGCDATGGLHTLREQWMIHRKLILVFSDEDVIAMLIAKRDGRPPEEVVGQKIERFRLSM